MTFHALTVMRCAAWLFVVASLVTTLPVAADERNTAGFIADRNGCKVANPNPQPGETITWSGACRNGFADGEGVLEWRVEGALAERYEGTLVQGWADGRGTLTKADGQVYRGEWKHSMENGEGRVDAPDGTWYEGGWRNGKPHGRGRVGTPDGTVISGTWVDGELQPEGAERYNGADPNRI